VQRATNGKLPAKDVASSQDETLAAIRAGLADVAAGRTKNARSAIRRLAAKFGMTLPDGQSVKRKRS